MGLHEFGWRQGQPLIEGEVGIIVAFEQFQEAQRCVANILDVVSHGKGDVAYIARLTETIALEEMHSRNNSDPPISWFGSGLLILKDHRNNSRNRVLHTKPIAFWFLVTDISVPVSEPGIMVNLQPFMWVNCFDDGEKGVLEGYVAPFGASGVVRLIHRSTKCLVYSL